ncbi:phage baseplate assembly protein V [Kushneria phosphatilytica]|uniref:Phage baseplate assembly protein V n=1 Tax=Kushneria phosphatilytica TaxID=657387 RepID=A0A1S1NVQ9_9GAMM|nr:phage baseplate assembly protein V [Kushneria phosphatilytica]OHV11202.1 hypothetical protein BH688_07715 [Kushneria phosphatilytica]QEL12225.1 phage baseplate assembly protein V [Kushneria phosphatilytica]
MNPVELARLLHNLIRLGTVAEIDHAAVRVRVQCGDLLTDWLPWQVDRAGATRSWNPPTVGEQVVLLAPGGELRAAIVLPSVNSDAYPVPVHDPNLTHWLMPDGAVIEYDHKAHHLRADLPGSASVAAPKGVKITGPVTIDGTLHTTGKTTCDADVVASGISLVHHVTTGVESGSSKSGPPE